uniref:IRG-type G domain-containing protein n=1 Tax=Neogobius melanostomus TaxID=47308 RepID=A0A8C6SB03_9GOBI
MCHTLMTVIVSIFYFTEIIMAEDFQTAQENNDRTLAAAKNVQEYEEKVNITVNIAITGESGSGKSTLVNALRGIKNKTDGAAPTGIKEPTMEPTEYPHPENPNIRIWDMPGIGTTTFSADKYLKHVGFEKYDFFIIVSSERFRENDAKLAKEIQKMNKKFYFVRSKIEHNIRDEKRKIHMLKRKKSLTSSGAAASENSRSWALSLQRSSLCLVSDSISMTSRICG